MMLGFFFVFFFQTVKNSFEKNYARSIGALNSKGSSVAVEDVFKDKQEIKKKKKKYNECQHSSTVFYCLSFHLIIL